MELFRTDGCLSDEGLHALVEHRLEELGRLEAAEHLAYCDRCLDRYTALLTADQLEAPPKDLRGAVMSGIWVRIMQNVYGRAMVAGIAAVLALTIWRSGAMSTILNRNAGLEQMSQPRPPAATEMHGTDLVSEAYNQLFEAWEDLMVPNRRPEGRTAD